MIGVSATCGVLIQEEVRIKEILQLLITLSECVRETSMWRYQLSWTISALVILFVLLNKA